jgi:hypothetical protein
MCYTVSNANESASSLSTRLTVPGKESVSLSQYTFEHDLRNWGGQWIWHEGPVRKQQPGEHRLVYFRRTFTLDAGCFEGGKPNLVVRVSANSRYRLFFNGRSVSVGPCKGDAHRRYYETVDLSDLLQPGLNVLAAQVLHYATAEPWVMGVSGPISVWSEPNGGFLLDGAVRDSHGKELERLDTGTSWRCLPANGYSIVPSRLIQWLGGLEQADGRGMEHGFQNADYDDRHWQEAVVFAPLRNPFGERVGWALKPRPIPPLYEREQAFKHVVRSWGRDKDELLPLLTPDASAALTVPPGEKLVFECDAGLLTTGYLTVAVSGGAGASIRLICAECYEPEESGLHRGRIKGIRTRHEGGKLVGDPDQYTVAGVGTAEAPEIYEPFWFRTFRYVRVEVETADAPVTLHALHYRETGYPLQAEGEFDCSDPELRQLWEMSLNTLRRCMHETYEDCPYYEQLQYTMDTRMQMLFTYRLTRDDRLARRAIEDYHCSQLPDGMLQCRYPSMLPQVIPSFSFYWIDMLEEHYMHFGDRRLLERYRPTMLKLLDWFEERLTPEGIVGMTPYDMWTFFDWVENWPFGAPPSQDQAPMTLHSLMYITALQKASAILAETGWNDASREMAARADRVREAVRRTCWSEERRLFANAPGSKEDFSVHAQVWAVLAEVVKGDEARELLERTLADESLPVVSLPQTFALMRALERTGLYSHAFVQWDRWRKFLGLDLTTTPEIAHGTPRSDCHAWSALPLYEFSASQLGVRPAAPGYASIVVAPRPEGLDWARGKVPIPQGEVSVDWRIEAGRFHLTVEAPAGIPLELRLPDGSVMVTDGSGRYTGSCPYRK